MTRELMNDVNQDCILQVQKQIELNEKWDGFDSKDELYVGSIFTVKELDDKVRRLIKSGKFDVKQVIKIVRYFHHIKKTGWFSKFMYRGFLCVATLDELGRWRIFIKYQYNSQRDIFYKEEEFDEYSCMDNSARCHVKGFPLGCWDYGEKLGLDDFIGLPTLIESEWSYDYFEHTKKQRKYSDKRSHWDWKGSSLVDIRTPTKMVKLLVDRFRKEVMKNALPLDEGKEIEN